MDSHSNLPQSYLFNADSSIRTPRYVDSGNGITYNLLDGTSLIDFSSGAGVSCLGHYQEKVRDAIDRQMELGAPYVPWLSLDTPAADGLAQRLIESTGGKMCKALFCSSGIDSTLT